jgi:hypothetical protein
VLWHPDRDWRHVAVQLRVGSSGRPAAELEGAAAGRDAHWGVMAKLSDALGCAFGLSAPPSFLGFVRSFERFPSTPIPFKLAAAPVCERFSRSSFLRASRSPAFA